MRHSPHYNPPTPHHRAPHFGQRKNRHHSPPILAGRSSRLGNQHARPCRPPPLPEINTGGGGAPPPPPYEALTRALKDIRRVQDGLHTHLPNDLVSQDLRECLFHLAEITGGEITTDEVLGNIFKNFCIGK